MATPSAILKPHLSSVCSYTRKLGQPEQSRKGWFSLRIIFLRTGTARKVSFVLWALGRNVWLKHIGNFPVRSCPEENYPEWKPALSRIHTGGLGLDLDWIWIAIPPVWINASGLYLHWIWIHLIKVSLIKDSEFRLDSIKCERNQTEFELEMHGLVAIVKLLFLLRCFVQNVDSSHRNFT